MKFSSFKIQWGASVGTRLSPAFYNNKLSPFFIVFTYFLEFFIIIQGVILKNFENFWTMSKYQKNVENFQKISKNQTLKNVEKCGKMSKNVEKCGKMSKIILRDHPVRIMGVYYFKGPTKSVRIIEISNYGGSNYGGSFIRRAIGILKGPTKSVRIIESSNYGSSNYGGSTVLTLKLKIHKINAKNPKFASTNMNTYIVYTIHAFFFIRIHSIRISRLRFGKILRIS